MEIRCKRTDVIWTYASVFLAYTSSLIILPFNMRYLSSEHLGLWQIFLAVGNFVILFDFGFGPTLARNVAYCFSGARSLSKEGVVCTSSKEIGIDYTLLGIVLATCKRIYFIISIAAFGVMLVFGTLYIYIVSKDVFDKTIIISWFIYCISVFTNLYYGYFTQWLRGAGEVEKANKATIFSSIFYLIISIVLLFLGYGILGTAIGYFCKGISQRVIAKKYVNMQSDLSRALSDKIEEIEKKIKDLFQIIWVNAKKDGLVSLANYFANQATTLVCSLFLSLTETGIYSISVTLATAIASISSVLYTAYQPSLQSAYATRNKEQSISLMSKVVCLYIVSFLLFSIALLTVGIPVLSIIKPDAKFSRLVIVIMLIYEFLYKHHNIFASYISNTNHVPYAKAFVISSVLGIVLSVFFVSVFKNAWCLALGMIVAQAIYNNWKWPKVACNMLEVKEIDLIKIGVKNVLKLK